MVTDRQLEVLRMLDAEIRPSLREIAAALGTRHVTAATTHVMALIRKGLVRRPPKKSQARSLILTPMGRKVLREVPQ